MIHINGRALLIKFCNFGFLFLELSRWTIPLIKQGTQSADYLKSCSLQEGHLDVLQYLVREKEGDLNARAQDGKLVL